MHDPSSPPPPRSVFLTVCAFGLALLLLVLFEAHPTFPDPDSFYHAKMALILRDQGVIHAFPWLQWTTLRDHYVDPHLLYHIILIPFVSLFDPLVGMKVSAIVFGMTAFIALYAVLRAMRTPYPELFVLAGALSLAFLQRMALPRAPALSIALLLVATWSVRERRPWVSAALAAVFVWFYHGWPVLLLSVGAFVVADAFASKLADDRSWVRAVADAVRRNGATALAVCGGLAFGLVVNPYFPHNFAFSIVDIVKIGIINYRAILPVGQEWNPVTLGNLASNTVPALALFVFSFAFALPGLARRKHRPAREDLATTFLFLFLSGGYLVLTMKSYRYVEYLVPFALLSAATFFPPAYEFFSAELWPIIRDWFARHPIVLGAATGVFTLALSITLATAVWNVAAPSTYYTAAQYEVATTWIKAHVPPGETVFHNVWDFSMVLFYLDDTHYYIVGLDPTFMYDEDPDAWQVWADLISGKERDVTKINTVFHARVVVVDTRMPESKNLEQNLLASPNFIEVASNEWIHVYADPSL